MQTVTECGQWELRRRVLPQHTDHAGVMWHGAYIAWLEEARVEALAAAGLDYSALSARGFELPVVQLSLTYHQVLRHGDAVLLRSWLLPRRGLKLCWCSQFLGPDGALAAAASVDLVLVTLDRAASEPRLQRRWPDDLAQAVAALQRGPT